jgi:transposase InsO family protein
MIDIYSNRYFDGVVLDTAGEFKSDGGSRIVRQVIPPSSTPKSGSKRLGMSAGDFANSILPIFHWPRASSTWSPAIMDWHSRAVLAWRISNTLHADFCVEALEEVLRRFGAVTGS